MAQPIQGPRSDFVWLDGELVPWDEATVHMKVHSLHYGLAVFEGTRVYEQAGGGSAVFRLEEHLERLESSARLASIELPMDREELRRGTLETIVANRAPACYLRHLAFIGAGVMGLNPGDNPIRVALLTWPWGPYLGADALAKGIRCRVSSVVRHFPLAALSKAKISGNYVGSILAKKEALKAGFDEAILLDPRGNVAEGSGENLFIVRGDRLETPPLTSVLPGITRDSVIKLAMAEGIEVRETYFSPAELRQADEVFLCGTAAEITPVREVDDETIGAGVPGTLTQRLQKLYFEAVRGVSERWRSWLEPVALAAAPATDEKTGELAAP